MAPKFPDFLPAGVIPAALTAFNDDFSINEEWTRSHFRFLGKVRGLGALTVNGHSSEVHALSFEEQERCLNLALEEVGDRLPVIAGVYTDGSLEAARIARMAERTGASALLVFPPHSLSMGGHLRPELAVLHFKTIADASSLPLILFQYPVSTGQGYPFETVRRMLEEVPTIRAMKDWCNDPMLHEKQTRVLQSLARPVNMLTTHSSWLMGSLVMGANGLLSGAGSVIADMQVALFEAIKANDLARAKRINDRMFPVVQAFYATPFLDMHNRMKECLVLLGRLPKAVVRPPLMKLTAAEIERLGQALEAGGIGADGAV